MFIEFIQVLPYQMRKQSGSHGLSRDLSTPENREFWAVAARARAIVDSWPEWKRNVRIGAVHD